MESGKKADFVKIVKNQLSKVNPKVGVLVAALCQISHCIDDNA